MKLAFVTSLAPTARPDTGFEIANAAIVEGLQANGHAVTIFAFARPDDALASGTDLVLLERITIENSAASTALKLCWLGAAVLTRLPFAAAKLWLAGRGKLIKAVREHGPFDAIILNGVMMPGAFPELTEIGPCLLVAHNLEHVSAAQNAEHARHPAMRWLYRREARLLRALEQRLARRSAFIWCLADDDRDALCELAGQPLTKAAVLPLVSTSPGLRLPDNPAPAHDVGLIGTWTWEPNLIGLTWFLDAVTPLLPPSIRIAVAGRTPSGLKVPSHVVLLGRVPDAAHFLGDCALVALASRAGTGVQLKTIENLQLGLPAVATSLSMRGLAAKPGNVILADEPETFAAAIQQMLANLRSGAMGRLDGSAFKENQRKALARALQQGLDQHAGSTPDRSV